MDLSKLKTDPTLELEGTWVDVDENSKILIARMGNDRYQDMLKKKLKPHRTAIKTNMLKDAVFENIMIEVIAHTVLIGWENIEDEGVNLPYTTDNAKRVLTKYKDFRDFVAGLAQDAALFRKEELDDAAKN